MPVLSCGRTSFPVHNLQSSSTPPLKRGTRKPGQGKTAPGVTGSETRARSLEWRADANKAARRAAQAPSGQQTCAWKCGPAKLFNSLLKPRYLIKAAATTAQPCPPITGQPRGCLGQGCRNVPPPVSGVQWTQPKCPGVKTTVTDSNWQLPG